MTAPHDIVRRLALALPNAAEEDHHGRPSFRVGGKIFATLPDGDHVNVMLDEPDIRRAIEAHPDVCEGQMWGKKLAALRVAIAEATPELLDAWLSNAWERRAL